VGSFYRSAKDNEQRTLLHVASQMGFISVIEYLIKNGGDPNSIDLNYLMIELNELPFIMDLLVAVFMWLSCSFSMELILMLRTILLLYIH